MHWNTNEFDRKLHIAEGGVKLMYVEAMILHNIRNCLYQNPVSQVFDRSPSTSGRVAVPQRVIYVLFTSHLALSPSRAMCV